MGGLIDLTKMVWSGKLKNGFAIVRPPGHHAETKATMGFCIFNNVAIAAKYAHEHLGCGKVRFFYFSLTFLL